MSKSLKKMGFLDSFMAHNVNISAPAASAKWTKLMHHIKKYTDELSNKYRKMAEDIISFPADENRPDSLFEFSTLLLALIESNKEIAKNDPLIFDIAENFVDVAKLSYDKRIIDMANSIIELLVSLRK